ncbi:MAG: hypothetical protein RID53_21745 [Coleofasciculus sp. B1-GNL1-01]|uniref:hypothetical protein n=1 Tax=Coleofasciculus sp. B1-GNL1-01 TaxID=3068484 RepID=UPI0032F55D62
MKVYNPCPPYGNFPDIKPAAIRHQPSLEQMLADPNALPSTHQLVEFTGKLLGRRGLQNWLGVDLIIETDSGLVKLHYFSILGSLGNLLPLGTCPSDLVGESVTVMGWFRRGVTPWIDVETLSSSDVCEAFPKGSPPTRTGLSQRLLTLIWYNIFCQINVAKPTLL